MQLEKQAENQQWRFSSPCWHQSGSDRLTDVRITLLMFISEYDARTMVLNTSWCSESRRTFDSNFLFQTQRKKRITLNQWISAGLHLLSQHHVSSPQLTPLSSFVSVCYALPFNSSPLPPVLPLSLLLFIFCQMTAASQDKRQPRQERRRRGRMRYEDGEETARVRMTERRGASGVIESSRWRRRRRRLGGGWGEGGTDGWTEQISMCNQRRHRQQQRCSLSC